MLEDWSEDVPRTYDDGEPAGHVNRQEVVVPSDRHLELYRLLRSNSHRDEAGRLVSWWTQPKLAARLGVSVRTLRNLLADLRQPGLDPRHPRGQPPGLRLGLVRVEPTRREEPTTGRTRFGANRYVLDPGQQATRKAALTSGNSGDVACLNKSTPPSLEDEGECLGVTGVSSTDVLDVGNQREPTWAELGFSRSDILAALTATFGPVKVLAEWPNDQLPPRSVRRWRTVEESPRRPRRRNPRRGK
jgi:hypothetical protein